MKKILILLLLAILTGCSKKDDISKKIELNLNKCNIEKYIDNHSGFLGDGEKFAKIECNSLDEKKLENKWKKLPLSNEINKALEMEICDNSNCKNTFKKYNIPNIENGYYYFLDRHSKSKDKHDDSNLNNRSSYNFSIALYDKDKKTIYFYELDT